MEKILNNKRLKIGLLAVAGLLLTGGLVWAGVQIGKQQATRNTGHETRITLTPPPVATSLPTFPPEPPPSPLSSETPAKEGDETAGWKTYQSYALNFSIKYPSDWSASFFEGEKNEIRELTTIMTLYRGERQFFTISVDPFVRSFEDLWFRYSKFSISDGFVDTMLGSLPAKKVILWYPQIEDSPPPTYSVYSEEYLVNHAGFIWRIDYPAKDDKGSHDETFDQILSTFQFLD